MRPAQRRPGSIPSEAARKLHIKLVQVEFTHGIQEFGGQAFGEALREAVAPIAIFGLQSPESLDGIGPSLEPRALVGRSGGGGGLASIGLPGEGR